MRYTGTYESPLGKITIAADETGLTDLFIEGQKYSEETVKQEMQEREVSVILEVRRWLDIYFSGKEPDFEIPLHLIGSEFRKEVWKLLCGIPYGKTVTYGEIAKILAEKRGCKCISAQAVGGAVGHNPIAIIVPCHRVMGANGNLTGYGGGIDKKIALLKLEHAYKDYFYIPKKGTAL